MFIKKDIPNILTIARGVFTILIIILFLINYDKYSVTIWSLFVIASFTDFFDGYFARKWNVVSEFGKIVDPLLDKILVFSLLILLFEFSIIPKFFIIILILRDIFIDSLRNYFITKDIVITAIYTAKIKTTFQMLTINFILLTIIFPATYTLQKTAIATGAIAVIFSLWSAISYIKIFHTSLRKSK